MKQSTTWAQLEWVDGGIWRRGTKKGRVCASSAASSVQDSALCLRVRSALHHSKYSRPVTSSSLISWRLTRVLVGYLGGDSFHYFSLCRYVTLLRNLVPRQRNMRTLPSKKEGY